MALTTLTTATALFLSLAPGSVAGQSIEEQPRMLEPAQVVSPQPGIQPPPSTC